MPPTPFLVVFSNYVATVIQYVVEQLGDMNLQKEITTWAPSGFLHPISSQLLCQNLPQGWYATNKGPVSVSNLWSMQSFLASLSIVANQLVFFHLVLIPINTNQYKASQIEINPVALWKKTNICPYPMTKFQIPCRSFVAPRPHSRLPEAAWKPISVAFCCVQVLGVQGAAWCKMQSKGCKCKPPTADSRFSFHQCAWDSLFTLRLRKICGRWMPSLASHTAPSHCKLSFNISGFVSFLSLIEEFPVHSPCRFVGQRLVKLQHVWYLFSKGTPSKYSSITFFAQCNDLVLHGLAWCQFFHIGLSTIHLGLSFLILSGGHLHLLLSPFLKPPH